MGMNELARTALLRLQVREATLGSEVMTTNTPGEQEDIENAAAFGYPVLKPPNSRKGAEQLLINLWSEAKRDRMERSRFLFQRNSYPVPN